MKTKGHYVEWIALCEFVIHKGAEKVKSQSKLVVSHGTPVRSQLQQTSMADVAEYSFVCFRTQLNHSTAPFVMGSRMKNDCGGYS